MAILLVEQYFDFARELADTYRRDGPRRGRAGRQGREHGRKRRSALPYRADGCACAVRVGDVGAASAVLAATHGRLGSARRSRAGAARPRSTSCTRPARRACAFPSPSAGAPPEAVLLNTAGGLTGGDRIDVEVTLARGAEATVTTAAAEKIYRARDGEAARSASSSTLAPAPASPGCRSRPSCSTARASIGAPRSSSPATPRFLAVETLIFGRAAMGEDVHRGACRDAWRVRRDGALVFADSLPRRRRRLPTPSTGRRRSMAPAPPPCCSMSAPMPAARLDAVRALLDECREHRGASTWNGLLLVRAMAARRPHAAGRPGAARSNALSGRPLPRVWQC